MSRRWGQVHGRGPVAVGLPDRLVPLQVVLPIGSAPGGEPDLRQIAAARQGHGHVAAAVVEAGPYLGGHHLGHGGGGVGHQVLLVVAVGVEEVALPRSYGWPEAPGRSRSRPAAWWPRTSADRPGRSRSSRWGTRPSSGRCGPPGSRPGTGHRRTAPPACRSGPAGGAVRAGKAGKPEARVTVVWATRFFLLLP